MKIDKNTGLPKLPEGWGPFEVSEDTDREGLWAGQPRLRIKPMSPHYIRERNVDGYKHPRYVTKGDIRRAAKELFRALSGREAEHAYDSPFIGTYPPKNLKDVK